MLESLEAWFQKEKTSLGNTIPAEIESLLSRAAALDQTILTLVDHNTQLGQALTAALVRITYLEGVMQVAPNTTNVVPAPAAPVVTPPAKPAVPAVAPAVAPAVTQ